MHANVALAFVLALGGGAAVVGVVVVIVIVARTVGIAASAAYSTASWPPFWGVAVFCFCARRAAATVAWQRRSWCKDGPGALE